MQDLLKEVHLVRNGELISGVHLAKPGTPLVATRRAEFVPVAGYMTEIEEIEGGANRLPLCGTRTSDQALGVLVHFTQLRA